MTERDDLDRLIEELLELRKTLPQGVKVLHHDCEWGVFAAKPVVAHITEENGHLSHHTDAEIAALKEGDQPLPSDEALEDEWDEMEQEDRAMMMNLSIAHDAETWVASRKSQHADRQKMIAGMEAAPLAIVLVAKH